MFPPFIDLSALAETLEKQIDNKLLRRKLEQAWRAQSCLGDLRQADDCRQILRKMVNRSQAENTPDLMTIERSLLLMGVILYVRATATSGQRGERGSIQLKESALSPEQLADHRDLVEVRNQAFAHVYGSQPLASHVWHKDIFFAVEMKSGVWKPASATNQTSYHADTLDKLERMLPIANKLVLSQFHRRMKAVEDEVNSHGISNAMLMNHAFDPVAVFGSELGVLQVLASAQKGTGSFWTNE
jgi:hypothetical protein